MTRREETKEKIKKEIYDFIKKYIAVKGYFPTYSEIIGGTCVKSKATVHNYLKLLKNEGLIYQKSNSPRAGGIDKLAHPKNVGDWETRLTPKIRKKVLVYTGEVEIGEYIGNGRWKIGNKIVSRDKVKGWMNMPKWEEK